MLSLNPPAPPPSPTPERELEEINDCSVGDLREARKSTFFCKLIIELHGLTGQRQASI